MGKGCYFATSACALLLVNFFAAREDFPTEGLSHCSFWNLKSGIWPVAEGRAVFSGEGRHWES